MTKICIECGVEFEVDETNHNQKRKVYCTSYCSQRARKKRSKDGHRLHNMICAECNKVFLAKRLDCVCCSLECKEERHKRLVRENNKKHNAKRRGVREVTELKSNKVLSAHEFNQKAKEMGMSYGQYDAYLRMQAEREERECRKKGV